jgi:hypothetical protein
MISSEVQRTLVKSPPELWAELSDPAALARHLGELGEIRITRTVPEKSVEWEAEDTIGKVVIKPSGWGTKVTLSVSREISPLEPREISPLEPAEVMDAPEPAIEVVPEAASEPAVEHADDPEPELEPVAPAGEPSEPELEREPRRGFFARLFRRRRKEEIVEMATVRLDIDRIDPSSEAWGEDEIYEEHVSQQEELLDIQDESVPDISDISDIQDLEPPDISAELKAAEEVAAEQVTAVLTSVLDRLGAAHHRPFSRA